MTAGRDSRRGRWHSERWWTGHHHARDTCGKYAEHDGARCHRDSAGNGERRLHEQLEREHQRHLARKAAESKKPRRSGSTRAELRDDLRLGQHAQQLRAQERGGYKTEDAIFYGSDKHAAGAVTEKRITTSAADREARNKAAHDREEAATYKARQRDTRKGGHWLYKPLSVEKAQAEAAAAGW